MFNIIFYVFFIVYEELIFRIMLSISITSNILSLFFISINMGIALGIISNFIPKKINRYLFNVFNFILCFYYGGALIIRKVFNIDISFSVLNMYKQFTTGEFTGTVFSVLESNIVSIILVIIPFIIGLFITRKINKDINVLSFVALLMSYFLFLVSLNSTSYDLYFNKNNHKQNIEYFGVGPSLIIELFKGDYSDEIESVDSLESEVEPKEDKVDIRRQISSIDFNNVESDDKTILSMNNYFNNSTGTYTNEYTGYFEGKNLIYIMAESFDGYFVDEELTPTLYKLIHNGLYFSNYYSPTNLSTIGGEFSLLTGLLPDLQTLNWQWIQDNNGYVNYFPYGLGTLFKEQDYNVYAYHDYYYNFQSRDKYLSALGFDNYKACYNGLEEKMSCDIFPESDLEMVNASIDDYINDDHFMVYYATVSGHGEWGFGYNDMAEKNKELVNELPYSDTVKAYISANLELENALTALVNKLEEAGKLDDTVIVLAADHHPYFMDDEYVEEMAGKELDQFSLYKNNLIIYNSSMEHTEIDKLCNTIDVLPTVLNLFGIDYDSRLMAGKDILSNSPGLVIFADYSWLNDKGKYSYDTKTFTPSNGEVSDEYIEKMNNEVSNKYLISRNILIYDYYKLAYDTLK